MDNYERINDATRCYLAFLYNGILISQYKIEAEAFDDIFDMAHDNQDIPIKYAMHNKLYKLMKTFLSLANYCYHNREFIMHRLPNGKEIETLSESEFMFYYKSYLQWISDKKGKN